MKKVVTIIVAVCAFITSLTMNIYYMFDNDDSTNANVQEVIQKGKDVKDAIMSSDTSDSKS